MRNVLLALVAVTLVACSKAEPEATPVADSTVVVPVVKDSAVVDTAKVDSTKADSVKK